MRVAIFFDTDDLKICNYISGMSNIIYHIENGNKHNFIGWSDFFLEEEEDDYFAAVKRAKSIANFTIGSEIELKPGELKMWERIAKYADWKDKSMRKY